MNKLERIKKLMEECQISKKEAATIVNLFFGEISEALAKSGRVKFRGSCSFSVKEYNLFYILKDGSNNSISP